MRTVQLWSFYSALQLDLLFHCKDILKDSKIVMTANLLYVPRKFKSTFMAYPIIIGYPIETSIFLIAIYSAIRSFCGQFVVNNDMKI